MPLLKVTVDQDEPVLHATSTPLMPVIRHALTSDPGPVTVMIHGFRYNPGADHHCPHHSILSRRPMTQGPRIISWPRHLGLRGQNGEGLGISFGWRARGSIWRAYDAAKDAGDVLGRLLMQITQIDPERPIHLIAHSLGARVALRAIETVPPGTIKAAILMAGAEYGSVARRALQGSETKLLNITSRENDVFDFIMELLVRAPEAGDRMLGHSAVELPNVATVQLDDADTLTRLRTAGFPIAPPERRICHWFPYLRPGIFPLYRAFLTGRISVAHLRTILPYGSDPRWAGLRRRRVTSQFTIE